MASSALSLLGRSAGPPAFCRPEAATRALRFFSLFIGLASDLMADALALVKNPRDAEEIVPNRRVADAASLASPAVLHSRATSIILDPYRRPRSNPVLTGPMEGLSLERSQNFLPLSHQTPVDFERHMN